MRKLIILTGLLLTPIFIGSAIAEAGVADVMTESMKEQKAFTTVSMIVDGLVCESCAVSIKEVFEKRGAVSEAKVDLDKSLVAISFPEKVEYSNQELASFISEAGYKLVSVKSYK